MSASYHQIYAHLVWTTAHRAPLLHEPLRPALMGYLDSRARALQCVMLAAGGVEDHVHALVRLHATIDVARLARELKAPSSGYIRRYFRIPEFAWQAGYGAFSVRRDEVPKIVEYIRDQRRHHTEGLILDELEAVPTDESRDP